MLRMTLLSWSVCFILVGLVRVGGVTGALRGLQKAYDIIPIESA